MKQPSARVPPATGGDSALSPVALLVHLSGSRRGTTERLGAETARIGTAADAEIHFSAERESSVSAYHATLHRRGATYGIQSNRKQSIWVNGKQVMSRTLASGDMLQIGRCGPLLRFRLRQQGNGACKSVAEAFSDCVDCARYGAQATRDRAAILLTAMPRELATQTSLWFRLGVLASLLILAVGVGALGLRNLHLEERLADEQARSADTYERVAALEARVEAGRRVISSAKESIVFLQLAYGFVDPESGKPLRFLRPSADDSLIVDPSGSPILTPEGEGPVFERFFTGTAFVASDDGLLLTNRHVAKPWEEDPAAQSLIAQGFTPAVHRFVGYLAGVKEPFNVKLIVVGDEADVAVLQCSGVTGRATPLTLSDALPQPGDEVIVLGYPTGMRALLARAGETFVEELRGAGGMNFWTVARRLSETGHISPLATRGIVGQVSPAAVVYDAETTSGGSGGPVVDLDGEVVAVNTAILPEFGGSNLGVPAHEARKLLAMAISNLR